MIGTNLTLTFWDDREPLIYITKAETVRELFHELVLRFGDTISLLEQVDRPHGLPNQWEMCSQPNEPVKPVTYQIDRGPHVFFSQGHAIIIGDVFQN